MQLKISSSCLMADTCLDQTSFYGQWTYLNVSEVFFAHTTKTLILYLHWNKVLWICFFVWYLNRSTLPNTCLDHCNLQLFWNIFSLHLLSVLYLYNLICSFMWYLFISFFKIFISPMIYDLSYQATS